MKYFITLVLLPAAALAMTMPLSNMAAYKVAAEPRDSSLRRRPAPAASSPEHHEW